MYYPIGWPRKLSCNVNPGSPLSCPESESVVGAREPCPESECVDGVTESLGALRVNGDVLKPNEKVTGSNGHIPQSPETGQNPETGQGRSLSNGSGDREERRILEVIANGDRSLLLVLTYNSVRIWFPKPAVQIVSHSRNETSILQFGQNLHVNWKPDSTMIVIRTSKDMLLFYKVVIDDPPQFILEQNDGNIAASRRSGSVSESIVPIKIPSIYLFLTNMSTQVTSGISSILAAEEEVVVSTKSGELIGVNWNGTLDPNFRWEVSDGSPGFQVIDLRYSSMVGGFSLVFSNGKIAFMPIHYIPKEGQNSPNGSTSAQQIRQRRSSTSGVSSRVLFLPDVSNGSTSAINHRYQILAFGLQNAQGMLSCVDEENSLVLMTHKLVLPPNMFPESASGAIGCMNCLEWSPDSTVLATSWEKGAIALWSVFGALLFCSLSSDLGSRLSSLFHVSSMTWGREGYHLWMVNKEKSLDGKEEDCLRTVSIAKSILATNPTSVSSSRESLLLVSEDRLHLGVGTCVDGSVSRTPLSKKESRKVVVGKEEDETLGSGKDEDETLPSTNSASSFMEWKQSPVEVGNHQWIVIQMPTSYLSFNWPIRLSGIDSTGQSIAIAGKTGFAFYNHSSRKWKLFGNESQERDFEVCGGLLWFENFIVMSCYSFLDDKFELRAYSKNQPLNNQFSTIVTVQNEVHVMSLHKHRLIVLFKDSTLSLYHLFPSSTGHLQIKFSKNILITNLILPPECVISIFLTCLQRRHPSSSSTHFPPCLQKNHPSSSSSHERDSILINISGRLFLLEKEERVPNESDPVTISFRAVSVLASGVENVWVPPNEMTESCRSRPHLTDALWLSRGSNGMSVWLPLLPTETERSYPAAAAHSFISERIMIPVRSHIYPLAVLVGDAVVIGAENETSSWNEMPFCKVSRTSQVYLPHILRELLKRNLGNHAWEIANTCSTLAYFPHSLELLLHETLEDEAVLSQPIPDALLPRVIGFIREFPAVFLQTVAHCARKTELALWPHLFAIVGNPKDLFQSCLDQGHLETAASYLLVLQNLEQTSVSKKYAILLLESTKHSGNQQLENDLTRFLQVIWPTGQMV